MKRFNVTVLFAALAVSACSSSMSGPDVAEYQRTASSISSAATAHRSAMAAVGTLADCNAERDRYRGQMMPMIDRMQAMSGDMDSCMHSMGHTGYASMVDACASMRGELDRHMTAACASSTMSDNAAEAAMHEGRMTGWANTESGQAMQMQNMMGGSGMMGGGMMGNGMCRMQ